MLASTLMFSALPQRAFAQSAPAPDATPATAQAPAADPAPPAAATQEESKGFWEGTELGGLLDVYYDYYSTKPEGDALYRNVRHEAQSVQPEHGGDVDRQGADGRFARGLQAARDRRIGRRR